MASTTQIDHSRRALLGVAAAGILDPNTATAGAQSELQPGWRRREQWRAADPDLASRLRSRLADLRADMEGSILLDRPGEMDEETRAAARDMREGLAALELFKEFERVPVEAQVQPEVQGFFQGVLVSIGRATETASRWVSAWTDGPGLERDPDATHLRAALRVMRMSIAGGPLELGEQGRAERAYADLADGPEGPHLRARLRRALRRHDRARDLAHRMATHHGPSGILEPTDPAIRARILAAAPDPSLEQEMSEAEVQLRRRTLFMASVMLGLGIVVGLFVLILGGCGLACAGESSFVALLLIGVAIIGLSIAMRVSVRAKLAQLDSEEQSPDAETPRTGLPDPHARTVTYWAEIPAGTPWVPTEVVFTERVVVHVDAWGTVHGGGSWAANADGDGVAAGADAPLPGAPARSLIGRVGDEVFFVGVSGTIPPDPDRVLNGPLELSINAPASIQPDLRGGFNARLRVEER
jgi:hypothetical protein